MNVSKTKLFCIKMFIFVEEFVKSFVPGTQLAIFRAEKVSWNKGTSISILSSTHERKAPQEKGVFFSLISLKEEFSQQMNTLMVFFFSKSKAFSPNFQKRAE